MPTNSTTWMRQILWKIQILKVTPEEIETLNRLMSIKDIKFVI